jgi:outer membrane protein TolC
LELVKALANAYYDLGFIDESLRVNGELFQMVQQMLQIAEASYASGQGLQQDVFQAQVELGKLIDDRIDLEKRHHTLAARINELLNRPAYGEVQGPGDLALQELVLDPEAVQRWTLENNPMLRVRQADIDRAVVNIDLARKNYYPDMDFNVAYGQREEDMTGRDLPDFVSASVVVNLPLWRNQKQDKQLQAEENRHKAATKAYESLQHALPHQVDAVLNEIDAIQENMRLFGGGLLEQTANWSQSALSAYEVGKVDFDTMIKAHMRALQFQLQAERYRFQYTTKLTELETLAGIALKDIARPAISAPGAAGPAAPGQARQTIPTPPTSWPR